MPEPTPIGSAERQIGEVRRALLDAAAFGKVISPEQLEQLAGKLSTALKALQLAASRTDSDQREV
ncbi:MULTISPECIES: DUF6374 family protein [Nocardia]|uniref:DUF6374 family protein n=1 Tax=Nocardia TaxID=1817 RepID=UPI00245432A9|nr:MULTISPECIES: DUF6374 family protein [Nocardia]